MKVQATIFWTTWKQMAVKPYQFIMDSLPLTPFKIVAFENSNKIRNKQLVRNLNVVSAGVKTSDFESGVMNVSDRESRLIRSYERKVEVLVILYIRPEWRE